MAEPRVALVTGAARGIGAATVHELCRQGYRIVAVDLDERRASMPAQDEGSADHEVADTPMLEVVHVRAAHPNRAHLDQGLTRPRLGDWACLELDPARLEQNRSRVLDHQLASTVAHMDH